MQRLLEFGLRYRLLTLCITVLITLLTLPGLKKLKLDTNIDSLIYSSSESIDVYEQSLADFGSDNNIFIFFEHPELFTPQRLDQLNELYLELASLPNVDHIDSLFSTPHIHYAGDSLSVNPAFAEIPADLPQIKALQQQTIANPLLVDSIISKKGNALAFNVILKPKDKEPLDGYYNAIYKSVQEKIDAIKANYDRAFQLGHPRLGYDMTQLIIDDMKTLAPLSLFILLVTVILLTRSLTAAVITLTTSGLTVLWCFGILGYLGVPINYVIAILPSLILVIGCTEDLHLFAGYAHEIQYNPHNPNRKLATQLMLRHLGGPILLTIITTFIGFSSNAFAQIKFMTDFAIASGIAVAINGLLTCLLVPLMLSTFGPLKVKNQLKSDLLKRFITGLANLTILCINRYSKVIILAVLSSLVFFGWQARKIDVDANLLNYLRSNNLLVKQTQEVNEKLAGTQVFNVIVKSTQPDAFKESANLNKIAAVESYLAQLKVFDKTHSIVDVVKLLNQELHKGNPDFYKIPKDRDQIEQYLLLIPQESLKSFMSFDFERANIVVQHHIKDSYQLERYLADIQKKLPKILGADFDFSITGLEVLFDHSIERLIHIQLASIFLILLIILGIMALIFTNIKAGLLCLLPNIFPIVVVLGIMGLYHIPLTVGSIIVFLIGISLAVDDTIHLFSRYSQLCRQYPTNQQALHETLQQEAVPVITSSLSLVAGFLVLAFSNFVPIVTFGLLAALIVLFALIADLVITPILLAKIRLVNIWDISALTLEKRVQSSPLFKFMSSYQIRKAVLLCQVQTFNKDSFIAQQGSTTNEMFVIISGKVKVYGQEVQATELLPGDVYAEAAYLGKLVHPAHLQCLTDVQLIAFDQKLLLANLQGYPSIATKLMTNLTTLFGSKLAAIQQVS